MTVDSDEKFEISFNPTVKAQKIKFSVFSVHHAVFTDEEHRMRERLFGRKANSSLFNMECGVAWLSFFIGAVKAVGIESLYAIFQ